MTLKVIFCKFAAHFQCKQVRVVSDAHISGKLEICGLFTLTLTPTLSQCETPLG